MKVRNLIVSSLLLIVVIGLIGCGEIEQENSNGNDSETIGFGSGPSNGPNYMTVSGIADIVKDDYNVFTEITTGSQQNIRLIEEGTTELGISMVDAAYFANNGEREYDESTKDTLNFVMGGPPTLIHFMVPEDLDIDSIADLEGKKIGVARGVMGQFYLPIIFEAYGLSEEDVTELELNDIANALTDGTLDVGIHITPYPNNAASELAVTTGIKLLEMDEDIGNEIIEDHPYFFMGDIEGGVYEGIENDVRTLGTRNTIIANADLDEEIVYDFTKAIIENNDKLDSIHPQAGAFNEENALEGQLIPIHPGAEKYYKEIGILE